VNGLSYTNRRGERYYLHAGRTKTGKPRYFVAKTPGEGRLGAMPEGYEFTESINAVVSVRRIDRRGPQIPEQDVELVCVEMARHGQLRYHRVECVRGEIVIFEPSSGLGTLDAEHARRLGIRWNEPALDHLATRIRYAPALKFVPCGPGDYAVHRMTYLGQGGWSWPLAKGALVELVGRFVGKIGTDAFFDLM
jgi:hypothetical protein